MNRILNHGKSRRNPSARCPGLAKQQRISGCETVEQQLHFSQQTPYSGRLHKFTFSVEHARIYAALPAVLRNRTRFVPKDVNQCGAVCVEEGYGKRNQAMAV
jgi:hypothetical protein